MNKLGKISITTIAGLAVFGSTVFGTTGKVYNTSQGLVLRGEASKSGAPLATIADGTEVEIIEETGEWYKVNVGGKEGYLFAEYVQKQEETTDSETAEQVPEVQENNNKTETETKIHIMPLITSSVTGAIPADSEIKVEKTVGKWSYVTYGEMKGWARIPTTTGEEEKVAEKEPETTPPETTPETKPQEQEKEPEKESDKLTLTKGYINSSSVNVRKEPNTSSEIITTLILNTGVSIVGQTDEWYKVTYGDYLGYIYKPLISETPMATSRGNETRSQEEKTSSSVTTQPTDSSTPVYNTTSTTAGEQIVSFAKQYLGYSYVYGGTTPGGGFDCSGFVYYVLKSCGYNISRSLTVQATTGTAVSKAELQLGDVIFFDNTSNGALGHVGIYVGDGRFIHAANPTRGVVTDTINSGYYNTYYHSARRIAQ